MKSLVELVRDNILRMSPYSCARTDFKGVASVYLDANENPYDTLYNRYPDPLQWKLKERISLLKGIDVQSIFLGNGSDEPIDLLMRIFCEPGKDNLVSIWPSYGMYEVAAEVNNVCFKKVSLTDKFDLDADALLKVVDSHTKLIYLCSPNNPTGNSLNHAAIEKVLNNFDGIVMLDEAYGDFSSDPSFIAKLDKFTNLVILQTMSKAWGAASIRLGMAFASPEIISLFNKIKYAYNVNGLTQECALRLLENEQNKNDKVKSILSERARLMKELPKLSCVMNLYPTDANFVLVKVKDANSTYDYLVNQGIIVRNRNNVALCIGCLRITVGKPEENDILLEALKQMR